MGSRQSYLESALKQLSDALIPSAEYKQRVDLVSQTVFEMLRTKRGDIDRFEIGGSNGKGTVILISEIPGVNRTTSPDIDVTVYVNEKYPPFRDVLNDFVAIFRQYDIIIRNVGAYRVFIEFMGFKIDVSVATNLRYRPILHMFVDNQKHKTLELIKGSSNIESACRYYSAGLTEYSVKFVRSQEDQVHDLIRLATCWNSMVEIRGYVYGRTYMIECVAIHAFRTYKSSFTYITRSYCNLRSLYLHFLKSMQNFYGLCVNLQNEEIPQHLRNTRPLILDPVNPFNNLASQRPSVITAFQKAATTSLMNLHSTGDDIGEEGNEVKILVYSFSHIMEVLDPCQVNCSTQKSLINERSIMYSLVNLWNKLPPTLRDLVRENVRFLTDLIIDINQIGMYF